MEVDRTRFDEVVRQGLAFVLRLALVLGGLGLFSEQKGRQTFADAA